MSIEGGEGVSESQTMAATNAQPRATRRGRVFMRAF
jgi:hypothetical protein